MYYNDTGRASRWAESVSMFSTESAAPAREGCWRSAAWVILAVVFSFAVGIVVTAGQVILDFVGGLIS